LVLLVLAGAPGPSDAACQVTEPNGRGPGAGGPPGAPPTHYGNGEMSTVVPRDGTVRMRPGRAKRWKFPWWIARSEHPRLRVRVKRLDAPGEAVARVHRSGSRWFHPVIVRFPEPGCWRITGRTRTARLRFTLLAVEDSAAER
jgi:hypothetical protein